MGEAKEPESQAVDRFANGCAWLLIAAVIGVVVALVWGGVSLVRNFMEHEPEPGYNEATTQDVTRPAADCSSMASKLVDLPESKRLDVTAQLEHRALERAVQMTCDTNVKVDCESGECTATYGGKSIVFDVVSHACGPPSSGVRRCEYRLEARNRFLSQGHVNEQFREHSVNEVRRGKLLRCDTIPGGADTLPPDQGRPGREVSNAPVTTKYRCYTRKPGSITRTYEVIAVKRNILRFEERT